MSPSTLLFATERALVALALALAMAVPPAFAQPTAPALPASVANLAPNLKAQGGGELTFFGISVYNGWYWSPVRGWPQAGPYALDLHYHRDLDGAKIAARSVEEIEKVGYGSADERTRWGEAMTRIFPDVRAGDRITGVATGGNDTVRFFHNGKAIGQITDPGFARAFFAIWLDPKTSQAEFRQKLLGVQ